MELICSRGVQPLKLSFWRGKTSLQLRLVRKGLLYMEFFWSGWAHSFPARCALECSVEGLASSENSLWGINCLRLEQSIMCFCSKSSKLHPRDRGKTVAWIVGVLWLPLTVLAASELPRSGRERLGLREISSLHKFDNSINAKDGPGWCHRISFLWISSLLIFTIGPIWLGQFS